MSHRVIRNKKGGREAAFFVDADMIDTRARLTAKGFDDPELLRLVAAAMNW